MMVCDVCICFFFKQKTADELRISDWSSDVCSSDLNIDERPVRPSNEGLVPMQTARTLVELRAVVGGWRTGGHSVALVPTMGALHAGHLRLVEEARKEEDRVVASIFVTPPTFGPNEDLNRKSVVSWKSVSVRE